MSLLRHNAWKKEFAYYLWSGRSMQNREYSGFLLENLFEKGSA